MPLSAFSALKANGPQTAPNGVAINASAMLGLGGGLGDNLQGQLSDQEKLRKKNLLDETPGKFGAAESLFGNTR